MAEEKRILLVQHLRHGDERTKTTSLRLSSGEDEINYYICRRNAAVEVKEDFEILSQGGQNSSCLAILRRRARFPFHIISTDCIASR